MPTPEHAQRIANMIRALRAASMGDTSIRLARSQTADELGALAAEIDDLLRRLAERGPGARPLARPWPASAEELQFSISADGTLVAANSATCDALGFTTAELLALTLSDIDRGPLAATWRTYVQECRELGSCRVATALQTKAGDLLPVDVTLRHEGTGQSEHFTARAGGLREREFHEKELLAFRFALEQAPDAVFWIDQEGGFPYVNERACRSLGYTRDELTKLHLWDIDPSFPRDRQAEEWAGYRKGELGMLQIETFHRRKDGTVFPVEISSKHFWFGDSEFHVAFARDTTERTRVQRALKFTQFAIDRASIACFWLDRRSRFLYVNDQACRSLGYTRDELLALSVVDIDPSFPPDVWEAFFERLRQEQVVTFESSQLCKDGRTIPVEITANHVVFDVQEHSCAFVRDVTEGKRAEEERARLESQLIQAQKLESVGRLAGGVAHEFNNMLSVILGYVELIRSEVPFGGPILNKLQEIERAANRSKETTRQLLAFSRKQIISPRVTDLNALVTEMRETLARLIGEDVEFAFRPAEKLCKVVVDRTQTEQILFNLVVNARDAMPHGGHLSIETANVRLEADDCKDDLGVKPGAFVSLVVRDDGLGMSPEVLSRAFEPFFTTKDVGKGTGLGLATVYGIVRQNEGFVRVDSAPGEGTAFRFYFPAAGSEDQTGEEGAEPPPSSAQAGGGRILLVEDDRMVRTMTTAMLERIGYAVRAVQTPAEALALCAQPAESFDLLLTDVVMPGLSGRELKRRMEAVRPGLRVLFMSGYTADVVGEHGVLEEGLHFIQKPFSMSELMRKLDETFGRS